MNAFTQDEAAAIRLPEVLPGSLGAPAADAALSGRADRSDAAGFRSTPGLPTAADPLAPLCWSADRLGEGLQALAIRAGLCPREVDAWSVPAAVQQDRDDALPRWVDWAATRLGVEAEAVEVPVPGVDALLRQAGAAVLQGRQGGAPGFLLLLGRRGGRLRVLGSDLRLHTVAPRLVRDWLCRPIEDPLRPALTQLLDSAGVATRARARALRVMLDQRLAAEPLEVGWLLRSPAGSPFWHQLVQARVPGRVVGLLAAFAALYACELAGWRLIGGAALDGRLDLGWLAAWVLLVLTQVPLQLLSGWLDAGITIDAGRLFKQRMLAGALQLDLDQVKRTGAGEWLSRVMEAQAMESLALGGSLGLAVAVLELGFASLVLSAGSAAPWHLPLLVACLALAALAAWRYQGRLADWTTTRLHLTHALVEGMVGHRTRLAQERAARRDAREDRALAGYLDQSRRMDRALVPLAALLPGLWVVLGLAALAPALVAGAPAARLAVSLGGLLFAHRALHGVAQGLAALARARVAWRQVASHFRAAAPTAGDPPWFNRPVAPAAGAAPLVQAQGLAYRYHPGAPDVLHGLTFDIRHGERLLLQGPSGGGKSTLASLLVGLRRPSRGHLMLAGLDRATLGAHWQRLATEAPQFHDNRVLGGTLAFNLLMGRRWPPSPDDLAEAAQLCRELGLGALLDRMPAGLAQRVGDTGWQLSHGEQGRVFLARALLQQAPLTVLDESFAALDPPTLAQCMDTVQARCQALVVVAHP